jgi:hypothetical protein
MTAMPRSVEGLGLGAPIGVVIRGVAVPQKPLSMSSEPAMLVQQAWKPASQWAIAIGSIGSR